VEEAQASETDAEADVESARELDEAEQARVMASIETVLFMSDKPVSLPKLRQTIGREVPLSAYRGLMARLREEFTRDHRGVEIAEVSMGFQLRTKPHMASVLRKMIKTAPLRLSAATMEVLAITAYKQPVTKDDLDRIRGVDSGYVLRNLMEKRLVRICGRSELPGKPMLYGTTHEFLELFCLKDVNALPPLHEVESMVAASEVGLEAEREAAMQEFSKMVATSDKILFDDSQIDSELEALRAEIASVRTSTDFIDEQKAAEKHEARLAELAAQGMTLNAADEVVPFGHESLNVVIAEAITESETETATVTETVTEAEYRVPSTDSPSEHAPSAELEAAAAAAQWERHAAMIAEAVAEAGTETSPEPPTSADEHRPGSEHPVVPPPAPSSPSEPGLDS
jgi:segregation and condensation protein B